MADSIEMQDIRGLDIDKAVKGFALSSYIFKNYCNVSSMSGDSVRWYQETAADPTISLPDSVEVSPLSLPGTSEHTWTRNTSYARKYMREVFISMEDLKTADIDVLARELLRKTRVVASAVDAAIWDVMSESQSASNINSVTTTSIGGDQWDAASAAGHPVKDILRARRLIADNNYDTSDLVCFVSPQDYEAIVVWIFDKGSQVNMASETVLKDGSVVSIGGVRLVQSVNVTADYALVVKPGVTCTWKSQFPMSSAVIEEKGIGTKIRVWEAGIALLTDPKSACLIIDTQT